MKCRQEIYKILHMEIHNLGTFKVKTRKFLLIGYKYNKDVQTKEI